MLITPIQQKEPLLQIVLKTAIFCTQTSLTLCAMSGLTTLAVHCHYDICSVTVGILQGVEGLGFV